MTVKELNAQTAAMYFYDIESLNNLFSVCAISWEPVSGYTQLDVYYLLDDEDLRAYLDQVNTQHRLARDIITRNPALREINLRAENIRFRSLHEPNANIELAKQLAISAELYQHSYTDPLQPQNILTPLTHITCDTNPRYYDPQSIFTSMCAGYNSARYDTVMLALYFTDLFANEISIAGTDKEYPENPIPFPTARDMRNYNDKLFESGQNPFDFLEQHSVAHPSDNRKKVAKVIHNNMLKSGRHCDVSRFNEVQSIVGLKRHLAQLGHQLLESDKLSSSDATISSTAELDDLLIYNVSDVMGLKLLFDHPMYANSFNQRAQLLRQYPECVYRRIPNQHKPDIRPERVDDFRLTVDSSSAQFVARVLSPYGYLDDIPAVSFNYPAPEIAEELGIEPYNVLDATKDFFYENIENPLAREQFDKIYDFYKNIEGRNFNNKLDTDDEEEGLSVLNQIPTPENNIPYFRANGTPTTGFATFSTGGIHGAEYFKEKYAKDSAEKLADYLFYARVYEECGGDAQIMANRKTVTITDPRTNQLAIVKRNNVIRNITTQPEWLPRVMTAVEKLKNYDATALNEYEQVNPLFVSGHSPELRKKGFKGTKLNPKYRYTSINTCVHEDFTSYYPLLLKNMRAFYNEPLGEDRYSKIFYDKQRYGLLAKDPDCSPSDKQRYTILRSGTKLLLNSASGAGDSTWNTHIKMNNRIISMRIIGQLFLWRIGQAQTLAGATIVSTNTDGLYAANIDYELNNKILQEQTNSIHVDIEPEPLTIVSKDANNRVEFAPLQPGDNPHDRKVLSAGGSLACFAGPNPSKRLSTHAITQYGLVELFKEIAGRDDAAELIRHDLDHDRAKQLIMRAHADFDPATLLTMYQMIIASNPSVGSYLYRVDYVGDGYGATSNAEKGSAGEGPLLINRNPTYIGKNNRIFIVDPIKAQRLNYPVYNIAMAKYDRGGTTPETLAKNPSHDAAIDVIVQAGIPQGHVHDHRMSTAKYSALDPYAPVIIYNHSLHHAPTIPGVLRNEDIIDVLDYDRYADILVAKYALDWQNIS